MQLIDGNRLTPRSRCRLPCTSMRKPLCKMLCGRLSLPVSVSNNNVRESDAAMPTSRSVLPQNLRTLIESIWSTVEVRQFAHCGGPSSFTHHSPFFHAPRATQRNHPYPRRIDRTPSKPSSDLASPNEEVDTTITIWPRNKHHALLYRSRCPLVSFSWRSCCFL